MKIVGITGGVGSGKSRILNELEEKYGAYIIEADRLAHKLMSYGEAAYNAVVCEFGPGILGEDKEIDRKKLGSIVFSDESSLKRLNQLTHPIVRDYIDNQIKLKNCEGCRLFVIEAALLIQDGYKDVCDYIINIHVDREIRISRLMINRGYTREKCESIIQSQSEDEYYMYNSEYTVDNSKDYDYTSLQIESIIREIINY